MTALIAIPCDRLYWAIVPHAASADARRFRCERLLPVPVDGLHLVETRVADGRWLLVGVEPEQMSEMLAAQSVPPWSAVPDRIPSHLGLPDDPAVRARLELLRARFEPVERRRWRRHALYAAIAAAIAVLLAVVVGSERRVRQARSDAADHYAHRSSLLSEVLPPMSGGKVGPDARMIMELRRFEQARLLPGVGERGDAADVVEAALALWPTKPRLQVEALTFAGGRLIVRGRAAQMDDAQDLARTMSRIEVSGRGYRSEPIQVQQTAGAVGYALTLVAEQAR